MSSTRRILPSFYCLQAHRHSSPVPHHDLPLTHSCKLSASPYAIVQATEVALNSIHQWTHLPWWAVIVGTTLALRTVITLPLAVYQMKMGAKQELLLPRLKELQEAALHNVVIKCRRANLPHTEANRIFQKEAKKVAGTLFRQEGCGPYKLYLMPWVQIPPWITLSFALRNMTGFFPISVPHCPSTPASMSSEGTLWFQDLTAVDPYYILPVLVAATNLLNIELHSLRRQQATRRARIFTNIFRTLSLTAGFISCQLPSAVTLYWTVSSSSALIQNLIVMLPRSRRMLNIPKVPSEKEKPFRYLLETIHLKMKAFLEVQKKKM